MRRRPPADALFLFLLLIARVRIDTLADMVLPERHRDVARNPLLGHIISPKGMKLLADWLTDPISLVLISIAFGMALIYMLIATKAGEDGGYRAKLALVWLIVVVVVFAPTVKLILLRHQSGPASYCHDGGVIQSEAAIQFALQGKSPYVENYTGTPMAEWGIKYHTALYHYPYLPWTFLFSAPFYLGVRAITGWYDQRIVYLGLFALLLALASALAERKKEKLMLVMLLGLNPIMASDVIFGQNDVFVLAWIVLALWLWRKWRGEESPGWLWASAAAYGLACASKPTAWYLAPFLALLLVRDAPDVRSALGKLWKRGWPGLAAFLVATLPYALWNFDAMLDDVWRWSSGTAAVPYQIRGWGASNFVLALGLVPDRLAYWPFWVPEMLVDLPLLAWFLRRQWRWNTPGNAAWHGGLLLLGFFYVSRFMNENYLGFMLALLAIGYFTTSVEEEVGHA